MCDEEILVRLKFNEWKGKKISPINLFHHSEIKYFLLEHIDYSNRTVLAKAIFTENELKSYVIMQAPFKWFLENNFTEYGIEKVIEKDNNFCYDKSHTIVENHAGGTKFKYCRTCKKESL